MLGELARQALEAQFDPGLSRPHRGEEGVERALAAGVPGEFRPPQELQRHQPRVLLEDLPDKFAVRLGRARPPDPPHRPLRDSGHAGHLGLSVPSTKQHLYLVSLHQPDHENLHGLRNQIRLNRFGPCRGPWKGCGRPRSPAPSPTAFPPPTWNAAPCLPTAAWKARQKASPSGIAHGDEPIEDQSLQRTRLDHGIAPHPRCRPGPHVPCALCRSLTASFRKAARISGLRAARVSGTGGKNRSYPQSLCLPYPCYHDCRPHGCPPSLRMSR